ncbi:MAG: endonuclease/exonuclease/phosphatase family protein [Armatimonadota bacterium]
MRRLRRLYPLVAFLLVSVGTFLFLESQCGTEVGAVPPKEGLRVATWNVMFLDEDVPDERLANLASVIRNLDADIIAFQEVSNVASLRAILPVGYEVAMAAEVGSQNLALAVREPLEIQAAAGALFEGAPYDEAFPDHRDPLRVYVATPSGVQLAVYVVHLKSRSGGRRDTDYQRIAGASLLAGWIRARGEQNVILLGDFNDTPDDASLNILETGDLLAVGRMENEEDRFLVNLCEPLFARDMVTMEVHTLFRGSPIQPAVRGARKENDRWRGKNYSYPNDLAIVQTMFDQILVSKPLADVVVGGEARIYAGADALRGLKGSRGEGTLASDHLPVFADFRIPLK